MTLAPKKTLAVAALALATIIGATTTTQTAQANEAVAGAIGFVAGALIGGAVAHNQPHVYYPQPQPVVVYGGYAPWTPAWYQACSQRYRSFNPNTGYFRAYSGAYIFCQ